MRKTGLIIAIGLLTSLPAIPQVQTSWVRTFGNDGGAGRNIAVDTPGNVYVIGSSIDPDGATLIAYDSLGNTRWSRLFDGIYSFTFTGLDMALNQRGDIYAVGARAVNNLYSFNLVRCSTGGDSFWTRVYWGPVDNAALPKALATDSLGNVYVTGNTDGPSWVTLKYDREGNLIWTALYTGYPDLAPSNVDEIALDGEGNVLVAGIIRSRLPDYYSKAGIIKYDNSGNQLWMTTVDSVDYLNPIHMDIDNSNNIFLSVLNSRQDTSGRKPMTIKILPGGNITWSRIYDAASSPEGLSYNIAVDLSGYAFITGPVYRTPDDSNYYDLQVIRYAPEGDTSWSRRYDTGYEDVPVDIAVGRSGAAYILGRKRGHNYAFDFLLAKYAPDGDLEWVTRYDGTDDHSDFPFALALDQSENIYATGMSDDRIITVKFIQTDTEIDNNKPPLPGKNLLFSAYPNPFNAKTTISFSLSQAGPVHLEIYNLLGARVAILQDGIREAGYHRIIWNAKDITSGVYFARLNFDKKIQTIKMVVLK